MQDNTHITLSIQQFNLLMEKICGLEKKIQNIEAKTHNIHRLFNKPIKPPVTKLNTKQQRAKDLENEIEQEKLEVIKLLNQT